MIRFFPLILILQALCLYHAYKNNTQQKWFWLIILFPFFGCLIYLYYHFFNRMTVDVVGENITKVVNSNYKTETLEKEVKFSDTVANKALLANEYINIGAFEKAIALFESCLIGTHRDDPEILTGLVKSTYLNKNYTATIDYAQQIESDPVFQKSEERTAYAWALFNTGAKQKAEKIFQAMDHQYSNYAQRLEFSDFLIEENRSDEAMEKLAGMIEEIDLMDRAEKRLNQTIYDKIVNLHGTLKL
ncbi:MAG: hypothetical protein ACI8P3_004586 [Saprospiraceae bacterium]|jgi:hypothetical protein